MTASLRGEERLLDPGRLRRLLRGVLAGRMAVERIEAIEVVNRREGRRLTVRIRAAVQSRRGRRRSRVFYGKLFSGRRRGERAWNRARFVYERTPRALQLPEPLGFEPGRRFLLLAEVPGEPWATTQRVSPAGFDVVGTALALLHGSPTGGGLPVHIAALSPLEVHDAAAEAEILRVALRPGTCAADPGRAERHARLVHRVIAGLLDGPQGGTPRLLHRDLHPGQLLLDGPRVGFVDLDSAALGEPELDVGNLLAHLDLWRVLDSDARALAAGADALREAYERLAPLSPRRLALYRAGALARLASLDRITGSAAGGRPRDEVVERLVLEGETLLDLAEGRPAG
jgi:aminoglycoside phosphotransferase (APT) family kinase protein